MVFVGLEKLVKNKVFLKGRIVMSKWIPWKYFCFKSGLAGMIKRLEIRDVINIELLNLACGKGLISYTKQ